MRFSNISWIVFVFILGGCNSTTEVNVPEEPAACPAFPTVDKSELVLKQNEGLVYQQELPFCGTSVTYYPSVVMAESIEYHHGKKHGVSRKWFADGTLSFEATYKRGKLHGFSRSWWENGKPRSETPYVEGVVHGEGRQWYTSGTLFKLRHISHGKEEGMQQSWRENGSVYNNYEAKNGRIFGLKRSNLCFALEDEEIQYKK